jgi:hypothetical protein
MSSVLTEVVVVGGLGVLAWWWLKDSAVGGAVGQVAEVASKAVETAAGLVNQALDVVNVVQQYNPVALVSNAVKEVQQSTDVGVGTIPSCRTEPVFDKGWDGLNWRGLGGGQTSCGCGDRENVDGLCYTRCPSGKSRVAGMPYLCR